MELQEDDTTHNNINSGLMWVVPGSKGYNVFLAIVDRMGTEAINMFITHIIPEDDVGNEGGDMSLHPLDPIQAPNQTEGEHMVDSKTH